MINRKNNFQYIKNTLALLYVCFCVASCTPYLLRPTHIILDQPIIKDNDVIFSNLLNLVNNSYFKGKEYYLRHIIIWEVELENGNSGRGIVWKTANYKLDEAGNIFDFPEKEKLHNTITCGQSFENLKTEKKILNFQTGARYNIEIYGSSVNKNNQEKNFIMTTKFLF